MYRPSATHSFRAKLKNFLLPLRSLFTGEYFRRYDGSIALYNAGELDYDKLVRSNFMDCMATAYATQVSMSANGALSAWSSSAHTLAGKATGGAIGSAATGMMVESLIEAGLADIHTMTQDKSGEEISLVKILFTGAIGGSLDGLLAAPELAVNFFKKIGELISPN
ncbi:MAG: hypothetical protein LBQ81_11750, partial [Zoogloeaceae bacterium]|nr:hypothetical protein [Zoogloeaceae bacterium]